MNTFELDQIPEDVRGYFKEVRGAAIQHPT